MITYRRITLADVDALTEFALSAIPRDESLRVSETKVRAIVSNFAIDRRHFQLAAFNGDNPVGGVALSVQEMPLHERCEGMVAFCFAAIPGVGSRLIRSMMKWAMSDMRVRRVVWPMNLGFDVRMWKLARRCGFQTQQTMFVSVKGGA